MITLEITFLSSITKRISKNISLSLLVGARGLEKALLFITYSKNTLIFLNWASAILLEDQDKEKFMGVNIILWKNNNSKDKYKKMCLQNIAKFMAIFMGHIKAN